MSRQNVSSNSPFEPVVGFSRAVRAGNMVFVSGTVAWEADGVIRETSVYRQARRAIENVVAALAQAGATPANVVRTRIYVLNIDRWEEVALAHREFFGSNPPASTMVEVSRLARPEMLVEIEADAVIEAE